MLGEDLSSGVHHRGDAELGTEVARGAGDPTLCRLRLFAATHRLDGEPVL
jgi:hypothetical protein